MTPTSKNHPTRILVCGGGFGGVSCALALHDLHLPAAQIRLLTEKPHFEYNGALYRVVVGSSPLEVCVPLREIFAGKNVEVINDRISAIDLEKREVVGTDKMNYPYDYLVLALGGETNDFGIAGIREHAYGFKSIAQALRLKRHLHELFEQCKAAKEKEAQSCLLRVMVVGGGATGIEVAGELEKYMCELARTHGIDPSLITIDLVEAGPRIGTLFPEAMSSRIARRLRMLGVNIFTNRAMKKEEVNEAIFSGMTVKHATIVWAAGVRQNPVVAAVKDLRFDKKGKVEVDGYLRAFPAHPPPLSSPFREGGGSGRRGTIIAQGSLRGEGSVFVVGDGASTPYSGMAQTAIKEGALVARNIGRLVRGKSLVRYEPACPAYAVPVGERWAAVHVDGMTFYGYIGWLLRRAADLRFFFTILPFGKAITAFRSGKTLCESCAVCSAEDQRAMEAKGE